MEPSHGRDQGHAAVTPNASESSHSDHKSDLCSRVPGCPALEAAFLLLRGIVAIRFRHVQVSYWSAASHRKFVKPIRDIALLVIGAAGLANAGWAQLRSGGPPSFHPAPPGVLGLSPEDIVPLPGTKWLIAGAASKTDGGGRTGLALINTGNPSDIRPLYPVSPAAIDWDRERFRDCPGPPPTELGTHGINIERLADGSFDLISVNHHDRESIEIFHLDQSTAVPRAVWRGCILMPAAASGNSVAPLPGHDGYIVTNFFQKDDLHYLQSMENGTATGNVIMWTPAKGWSPVSAQQFSGANGAEITPDGKYLFVSEWSDYKVWKLSLNGEVAPRSIHLVFCRTIFVSPTAGPS